MKKVLSVLLAAAMVMGMSVSAFAATFGDVSKAESKDLDGKLTWNTVLVERDGKIVADKTASEVGENIDLKSGDILYFSFKHDNKAVTNAVPSNWKVKLSGTEFVSGADFYKVKANDAIVKFNGNNDNLGRIFVAVELDDDFDSYEEDDLDIYFYVTDGKTNSERVYLNYDFADYDYETITKNDLNWIINVDDMTAVKYAKGEKAAYATIDFDDVAYGEFKMYAEEKYVLDVATKYNKNLSKEYDCDVEVITFTLKGVEAIDLVFPASKDNKQVVAVVDGELVPVEATYVKDYKFASGEKANGYLVENAEYLTYAVIDADVEVAVEETETPAVEETNKANPETGAADFVGAAVAMAVVSVAAAGALALKK